MKTFNEKKTEIKHKQEGKRRNGKPQLKKKHQMIITFFETFIIAMVIGMVGLYAIYAQKRDVSVIEFLMLEKDTIVKTITNEEEVETSEVEEDGWQIATKSEEEVTLLFAGDVLLDDSYAVMATYLQNGATLSAAFSEPLIEEMQNADIFMINNEFPYTDRGEPTSGKTFTFRAKPQYVSVLKDMGVDIVSLANNHAYDFGEVSLLDSMQTLQNADIQYVGAGNNIEEASNVVYAYANGLKIAYVAATQIEKNAVPDTKGATEDIPGVFRCNDPERLVEVIQIAKENSDFVVLYIHWGTESTTQIDELQKQQAPLYTQAGADLIIGAHSHCLQQIQYQEHVPIIYSLGNYWFNSKTVDTCLVKVTLKNDGMQWQFLPCRQSGCKTVLLDGAEKEKVLSDMRALSPGVIITPEGYITEE